METISKPSSRPLASSTPKKPQTRLEILRGLLNDLEREFAHLSNRCPDNPLQTLSKLDEATDLLEAILQAGGVTSGEKSLYETILAQVYRQRKRFLDCIGGATRLADWRADRQPPADHWWWFIDEALAIERQRVRRRRFIFAGVAALALGILTVLYRQFLAPDPALQASIGYQTKAENLLIEGRYEEALTQTNLAIEAWPDNPELFVLRGVIYWMLEEPKLADQNFDQAREGLAGEVLFLTLRARYFLMAGQMQQVLNDSEAALALDPDSTISMLHKAQAFEQLGEREKAIEAYQLASEMADRQGDAQLQVIVRIGLGQLLQSPPQPSVSATPVP